MAGRRLILVFVSSFILFTISLVFILSPTDNSDFSGHLLGDALNKWTAVRRGPRLARTTDWNGYYDRLWKSVDVGGMTYSRAKTDILGALLKKHIQRLRNVPGGRVELVFLVDSSASVGMDHFFNEIKFIKKLLADFTVAQWATRVAIVTFSSKHRVHAVVDQLRNPTNDSHKCSLLNDDLPTITYVGGGTYTKGAFEEARAVLQYARPGAAKTLFLITDGYSNGGDPRPIAEELRRNGVEIFTFGIRNGNLQELFNMSSDVLIEHCYILKNFTEFESLARRALHEDLEEGEYITENSTKCNSLCVSRHGCCHKAALCRCGTHTGQYECVCPAGYYGTGVDGDCKPCPSGTYKPLGLPGGLSTCRSCPDENHLTPLGSTDVGACYCPGDYRAVDGNQRCQEPRCPVLSPPEHGQFFDGACDNSRNKACAVMCDDGYKLTGSLIRLCTEAGEWTGTDFRCVEKSCDPFIAPDHGFSNCTKDANSPGTICTAECNIGYGLVGTPHRRCLPMITEWDGLEASCRVTMCRPMNPIANGYILPENCTQRSVPYGTTCRPRCAKGYNRIGSIKTRCGPDGDWVFQTNVAPQCTDITRPSITCPPDVTENTLPNRNYTTVHWDVPRPTDSTGQSPNLKVSPAHVAPPWDFPIGSNTVTYTAVDRSGLRATCSFIVTVIDNEPPQLEKCESPDPVISDTAAFVAVEWELPRFSDNSGQAPNITASHTSGELMPLGTTKVEIIGADVYGNARSCDLEIVVTQHVCEPPQNPAFGGVKCQPYSLGGLNCMIFCKPGYAFSVETGTNYICHPDGRWSPHDVPRRDCQETYFRARQTMRVFFRTQSCTLDLVKEAEKSLFSTLYDEIDNYCGTAMSCNVSTVSTLCKSNGSIQVHLNNRLDEGDKPFSDPRAQHGIKLSRLELDGGPIVEVHLEYTAVQKSVEDVVETFLEDVGRIPDRLREDLNNGSLSRTVNSTQVTVLPETTDTSCEEGSVKQSTGECVSCSKGTYFDINTGICTECPVGTFQASPGMMSCDLCPSGQSTTMNGSDTLDRCKDVCAPGTHSPSGVEQCESCPRGTYQYGYGATECIDCPRHTSTEHTGSLSENDCLVKCPPGAISINGLAPCVLCPIASYQPLPQKTYCHPCPHNGMTLWKGAESITACHETSVRSMQTAPLEEVAFSYCFTNPCRNGGHCEDELGSRSFSCTCQFGYTGRRCEIDIDDCESIPCMNNGTCTDGVGSFQCQCDDGFTGDLCGENFDECLSDPCENNGKCLDAIADFGCECPIGFEGLRCEQDVDECLSYPCMNGGTCIDGINSYSCDCPSNVTGDICAIELNECIQNTTVDQSACSDFLRNVSCSYLQGFAGSLCNSNLDYCASSPCWGNSACLNGVAEFTYICSSGMTGPLCDTVLPANFSLIWGRPTTTDYSILKGGETFEDLYELTVAFWMRTDDSENYGTPFSYATEENDNALTLLDYNGFVPYINNEDVVTDVIATGGFWHHIALTWRSEGGVWDLYRDGVKEANGTSLSVDRPIKGGGVFVIGQEQNEPGGGFDPRESFIGEMTMLNLWSRYMSAEEIYDLSRSCDNPTDALISWPAFSAGWSGNVAEAPLHFCEGCRRPQVPVQGVLHDYRAGTVFVEVNFTCNYGYFVEGNERYECQVSGDWLPRMDTTCRRVWCTYPGHLANGRVGDNGHYDIKYSCNDGFALVGPATRECQADGQWTGRTAICIRSDCGTPPWLPHGDFVLEGATTENTVTYACNPGYRMVGNPTVLCEPHGSWQDLPTCERISCGEPVDDSHLLLTFTNGSKVGDIRQYSCGEGYSITNAESRVCSSSGNWSLPVPMCNASKCDDFPSISHTVPTPERIFYGEVVEIRCMDGYRINGAERINCEVDGSWQLPLPMCEAVTCGEPPFVEYAVNVSHRYSFGENHTWSCRPGYILSGNRTSWCGPQATWYPSPPTCNPVICPSPPSIPNAKSTVSGSFYGQQTNYTCNEGYILEGTAILECSSSGNWTLLEEGVGYSWPSCEPISCGPPPLVENTLDNFETLTNMSYEEHVTYQCIEGFHIVGDPDVYCTANGTWQPSSPECQRVPCGEPPYVGNSTRSGLGHMFNDVVIYSCIDGYIRSGNDSLVCDSSGEWFSFNGSGPPTCEAVPCGHSPVVTYAVPDHGLYYFNESVTYSCVEGYYINGYSVLSCRADGTWPAVRPQCMPMSCGSPPQVEHANVNFNSTTVYGVSNYTCHDGYIITGPPKLDCGLNGTWQPPPPICRPVSCQDPPLRRNLQYVGNNLTYGSKIRYDCDRGYLLTGASTSECLADGSWSSPAPHCNPVSCGDPPNVTHGQVETSGNLYLDTANYSCVTGHYINGISHISCSHVGQWSPLPPTCSPVSCGDVPEIKNAYKPIGRFSYGEVVQYRCREGYETESDLVVACGDDGQWSGVVSECIPISCGIPPSVSHGRPVVEAHTYGHIVKYFCNLGYRANVTGSLRCESDGSWSGHETVCQPNDCGRPSPIIHGEADFNATTFGEVVHYSCFEGYRLIGSKTRRCSRSGWSGASPWCQLVYCDGPRIQPPLRLIGGNFHVNQTVEFSCDTGYRLSGERVSTCLSSGRWNSSFPECVPILCPSPTQPNNGSVITAGHTVGSLATYQCSPGYDVIGSPTRRCQENGTWSGSEVSCRPVDCGTPPDLENMTYKHSGERLHHRAEYMCLDGFRQLAEVVLECSPLGVWSTPPSDLICDLILCHRPEQLLNGYHDGTSFELNTTVTYSCDEGYYLDGEATFICSESGWTSVNAHLSHPVCRKASCDPLPVIPNGFAISNDTSIGGYAQVFCEDSFVLLGDDILKCLTSGDWSTVTAMCELITCRHILPHEVGAVIPQKSTYVYLESVRMECYEGYRLVGDEYRHCVGLNEWNGTMPQCDVVSCGEPPIPINGRVDFQLVDYGSMAQYTCYEGFSLSGITLRQCREDGQWSDETPTCRVVTCGSPGRISHGTYHNGTFHANDTVQYYCEYGYRLTGHGRQLCASNSSWIGSTPSCAPVQCPQIGPIANGDVFGEGHAYTDVVTFSCHVGYDLSSDYRTTCSGNGEWHGEVPSCVPRLCPDPPEFPGAYIDIISRETPHFVFQTNITFECQVGYRLASSDTITCTAQGTWDPQLVDCQPVECQTPEPYEGLTYILSNGTIFNSVVTFQCDDGYFMTGNNSAVCTEQGTWDSPAPICSMVVCPAMLRPLNGRMRSEGNKFEDSVEFTCDDGYHLVGESTLRCTSDGTWDALLPLCRLTVCSKPEDVEDGVPLIERLYSPDEFIFYKCNSGYSLRGPKRRRCQKDGTWSGAQPMCEPSTAELLAPAKLIAHPVCVLPCLHGGVCRGPYQCECRYGFTGSRCETALCMSRCSGGAKCVRRNRECRPCKSNGSC